MSAKKTCTALLSALALSMVATTQASAKAQDPAPASPAPPPGKSVGGHVGVATSLVTVANQTQTIGDRFTIAAPLGVTVKLSDRWAVDFEVVVNTPVDPKGTTTLVVDPGVIYNFGPVAGGLRLAWQLDSSTNIGLIPLINRGLVDMGYATWFIEAAFPMFIQDGDDNFAFNAVIHTGFGF
jgi:hypothetical protein